jgi:hypothetical protein
MKSCITPYGLGKASPGPPMMLRNMREFGGHHLIGYPPAPVMPSGNTYKQNDGMQSFPLVPVK